MNNTPNTNRVTNQPIKKIEFDPKSKEKIKWKRERNTKLLFIKKVALFIGESDGTIRVIIDDNCNNSEQLFELMEKTGINKQNFIKSWLNKKGLKVSELKNEEVFELCEYMAQNGYVIMIREEPSKKGGEGYNNIRLYFPVSYEEWGYSILINQIMGRLNPQGISQYDDLDDYTITIYKGNILMTDHQKLIDFFPKYLIITNHINHIKSTNIYEGEENVIVVTNNDNSFIQQKSDNEGYKILLAEINELDTELIKGIKAETNGSLLFNELSKRGSLVLGFVDNSFLSNSNQKALYIPKDITEESQQWRVLEAILKKYESMRNSDMNIPDSYSLSIYVNGVFLKKLSNDSYKWNGKDDYAFSVIIKEIKNKLERIKQQELCR